MWLKRTLRDENCIFSEITGYFCNKIRDHSTYYSTKILGSEFTELAHKTECAFLR